jgi:hypothetical protein
MRVVQPLTEQDVMSFNRTLFDTMKGSTTYKATTSAEEKVGIVRRKMGEGIKGEAVHSNGDRSREHRTLIESKPMGIVVIRHWRLNHPESLHRPFPLYPRFRYHFWNMIRQRPGQMELRG